MRYQVPQFVDIEDKIIGPFTLRQFLIYLVTVLLLIPVYLASDLTLFITLALPALGIAAAFAHIKIGNKTLSQTIVHAVNHTLQGQFYIWRRQPHSKPLTIHDLAWRQENQKDISIRATSLNRMAQVLETQGNTVKSEDVEDLLDVAKGK